MALVSLEDTRLNKEHDMDVCIVQKHTPKAAMKHKSCRSVKEHSF